MWGHGLFVNLSWQNYIFPYDLFLQCPHASGISLPANKTKKEHKEWNATAQTPLWHSGYKKER